MRLWLPLVVGGLACALEPASPVTVDTSLTPAEAEFVRWMEINGGWLDDTEVRENRDATINPCPADAPPTRRRRRTQYI